MLQDAFSDNFYNDLKIEDLKEEYLKTLEEQKFYAEAHQTLSKEPAIVYLIEKLEQKMQMIKETLDV